MTRFAQQKYCSWNPQNRFLISYHITYSFDFLCFMTSSWIQRFFKPVKSIVQSNQSYSSTYDSRIILLTCGNGTITLPWYEDHWRLEEGTFYSSSLAIEMVRRIAVVGLYTKERQKGIQVKRKGRGWERKWELDIPCGILFREILIRSVNYPLFNRCTRVSREWKADNNGYCYIPPLCLLAHFMSLISDLTVKHVLWLGHGPSPQKKMIDPRVPTPAQD